MRRRPTHGANRRQGMGQERPSGSHPLRPQLNQLTQKQHAFAFADSRERNHSSAVHYTPFSCVFLHCCGCSYGVVNRIGLSSALCIEVPRDILRSSDRWTQHGLPLSGRPSKHNRPPITSWYQPRTATDFSPFSTTRSHVHIISVAHHDPDI